MKLKDMPRETVIGLINAMYNKGKLPSQGAANYAPILDELQRETLDSMVISLMKAEMESDILSLAFHFSHRAHCGTDSIARFAALTEAELFRVHRTLRDEYGVTTDVISKSQAISGVLTFEDRYGVLTTEQQHRLAMILAVAGWISPIGTWEIQKAAHGSYSRINEESLKKYIFANHSDDDFNRLMTTMCSGQEFGRFLEVVESVTPGGTEKPLVSGVL